VRDDPIALLERELLDAAHQRAVAVGERDGTSHEPRGPWPHALRPGRRRSSLGAFAAVASGTKCPAITVNRGHGRGAFGTATFTVRR
jgi:hypothetical protein